ncbi:MAG: radical SAM family heme chaperone HemW [Lachnospiraceae bacterium]|nr:radical SAM family heme chaperone HemW [Lachnospiraceae bacterium]
MARRQDMAELYIHIPFCVRKCLYCDFCSFPADRDMQENYVRALCEELVFSGEERCSASLSSVFIGGGTPSSLPAEHIITVMKCVREHFDVSDDAEITIECNPGTVDADKLHAYAEAGINRISFGLQSADDVELKTLGRIHTYDDFLNSYRLAAEAGFSNINVDLMSGIPGQSLSSWESTLRKTCSLDPVPAHISAYSLIVEEETPFGEMMKDGRLDVPDEDLDREMYHMTSRILSEYGYSRYEISNYALDGHECRHNVGYWTGVPYYGAGLDASSYYGDARYANTDDIISYIKDPVVGHFQIEKLGMQDLMSEFMILGLRMIKGVSAGEFSKRFSRDLFDVYASQIEKHVKEGLLVTEDGNVFLSERGLDLANHVMQSFI